MTSWKRPFGPPNVWKVVDGFEKLEDGSKKPVKFSIQDIPNNDERRKEVIDLMCTYFLREEPLSKSLNIKEDPEGVDGFKQIWNYGLDQGVAMGCYKLDSKGEIGELVGANMLFIVTDEAAKYFAHMMENMKSPKFKKIWNLCEKLGNQANVCKTYNVNKYISSISLSILPAYRGQKLGYYILSARSDMAKKYGLAATSTLFTATASQIQAKRAGFEEGSSIDYADVIDEDGNHQFPNIESKCAKTMMKRLP